ncbi:heterogeneous nuclear ribonucleoprotein M isoform X2 [Salmo salar]|uniref:Heterogeneous nuclear ribonucleoprotein M isoform X2 n=1 Tax=Salmo salar TaxID=8030 RepID=A0A1S3MN10_SALSA|nr:heterogeneous nuclear ribonucleoprotein M isoform X2 [Salmo salar]XP_029551856.1 heterogeneous nuclear ribonucleoprotein M-like isoform X2 [Salmo trutta]|eukprot:XP_014004196.1 PREDICTED: heterogeneous nuclear ribonucleoprotein M-like isoform X2 [Salmo salar]
MSNEAAAPEKPGQGEINGKAKHEPSARKERPQKRGGGRFEPYGNPSKRYRVFVSNIPYDVKWQALKDLMKEKVGEVTYVEHLMDGEGKSRGCAVVEFRTEELMKKAVEKVNKHNLNGRPLKVKEDPDGVIAQRDAHRSQGGGGPPGGHGGMNMGMDRMNMERMNMDRMGPGPGAPPMVNIPPSLMNNSNIPNEIIHGLQAGKIGSTVFVANLDYKVGWKKLKEVFGMAGVVVRTDILEDKDGNSRGMGTVTFDMPIEAVQAVSMFNGQLLFNRVMHVKLDEKSLPKGDFAPPERPPALPRGLSGIGLGLGPGGQPIDATALNRGGGGMGNMGPGGMDNFGGMNNMERFGPSGMGRMNEMDRGLGGSFDREFGRNDMGMSRNNFGESFERGMGSSLGMDRMSSGMDRLGGGMDRLGGMERMGMERMDRVSDLDRLGGSGFDRMGSGLDRLGPSMDRLGSGLDRMSSSVDRLGPAGFDRLGPSSLERMPAGLDFASPMGMADRMERMGTNFDRMGSAGIERFPTTGLDRMGSTMDRMGAVGVGGQFDRPAEMERGGFGGNGFGGSGGPGANARKGCQIFVRNLPFDFTWKMLKDNFNTCGIVQYADIKMENGKSKGCGVVRFDNPETAERACRTMNGYRLNGREIDVRIDRNA